MDTTNKNYKIFVEENITGKIEEYVKKYRPNSPDWMDKHNKWLFEAWMLSVFDATDYDVKLTLGDIIEMAERLKKVDERKQNKNN